MRRKKNIEKYLSVIVIAMLIAFFVYYQFSMAQHLFGTESGRQYLNRKILQNNVNKKIENVQTNYNNFEKKIRKKQESVEF